MRVLYSDRQMADLDLGDFVFRFNYADKDLCMASLIELTNIMRCRNGEDGPGKNDDLATVYRWLRWRVPQIPFIKHDSFTRKLRTLRMRCEIGDDPKNLRIRGDRRGCYWISHQAIGRSEWNPHFKSEHFGKWVKKHGGRGITVSHG